MNYHPKKSEKRKGQELEDSKNGENDADSIVATIVNVFSRYRHIIAERNWNVAFLTENLLFSSDRAYTKQHTIL